MYEHLKFKTVNVKTYYISLGLLILKSCLCLFIAFNYSPYAQVS
ncbi:hypothetical protein DB41_EO00150 [Neochlamydia sp. TUME1]|nr:hypothetical protein DB41_EO00150 [Neochlamydia sp. TUME1]